jgi:hypothetical protein
MGPAQAEERSMSVFVYVNTAKQGVDLEHLKIFATEDAAKDCSMRTTPRGWRSSTRSLTASQYELYLSRSVDPAAAIQAQKCKIQFRCSSLLPALFWR